VFTQCLGARKPSPGVDTDIRLVADYMRVVLQGDRLSPPSCSPTPALVLFFYWSTIFLPVSRETGFPETPVIGAADELSFLCGASNRLIGPSFLPALTVCAFPSGSSDCQNPRRVFIPYLVGSCVHPMSLHFRVHECPLLETLAPRYPPL